MYIDAHVHFRDFKQRYKETIKHGLEVAYDSGVDAVFDMPNTDPPLMSRDLLLERLRIARDAGVPGVFYGMFMGLTADPEQVKRAVEIEREFPQVVGMKLYAGHSVGNLGVVRVEDQRKVYETLSREGYRGVLVVHAEKESELHPEIWRPEEPITHCHARPEASEIASIRDQISLAYQTGFRGKLHITHISSPTALEIITDARERGLDATVGICPHHFVYDWQQMVSQDGVLWKMNPPLRSPESRQKMLQYLRDGKIDWIETDHAPHTLKEKTDKPFMSGIPGIAWWPLFEEFLRQEGFPEKQIDDLTFNNVAIRFGLDISRTRHSTRDRRGEYPFNPYSPIENQVGWK